LAGQDKPGGQQHQTNNLLEFVPVHRIAFLVVSLVVLIGVNVGSHGRISK
jgi:hypothetical protein